MSKLAAFEPVAQAIATLFHPYVEAVIHDTERNCIAAIFNNFSNREIGDPSYLEDSERLDAGPQVHGPFEKKSLDGRRLKYVSSVLRDRSGQMIGLMCLNMDVHAFDQIAGALRMFLRTESSANLDSMFDDDWQGKIHTFVHEYLDEQGLTLARLKKKQRLDLIASLQAAGAFQGKNAAQYTANVLGVSRATIYNDLAQLEEVHGHAS